MTQSRQSTSSDMPRAEAAAGTRADKDRAGTGQGAANRSASGGDGPTQEAMTQTQDQVGKLAGQARQQATTQLATQKERAASTLGTLAGALHEASRQVREQDDAMMAGYIDTAAGQLDRLVDTLNQQDLGQIIDSAGRFARRQPAVFLAAAIAVGFAGARFLRSSSHASGRGDSHGYGASRGKVIGYGSGADTGSVGSGTERDLGYGSVGVGDPSGFAGTPGSGRGSDWQARSAFDAGPEGQ